MPLPPLLVLPGEKDYRAHFEAEYCRAPVVTFDGISVHFFPGMFDHAFYRDSSPTARDKANFDLQRAQRMSWIKVMLDNPTSELYRRVMPNSKVRRIVLEPTAPYAVIIQIDSRDPSRARFITAYVVNSASALRKMRSNPRW
ncbi:MAG: hypothetical protein Kow0063_36850 [Anaerolineae bacterium]